jgi:hypothetical protein
MNNETRGWDQGFSPFFFFSIFELINLEKFSKKNLKKLEW